jgi:2-polyprenyl-3-methyl-5-hydroxy-6-metoxy-1,4-benzoquinol methylase
VSVSSILDYGSGTGHFLTKAKNNNWITTGVEPDKNARSNSSESIQQDLYPEITSINKKLTYDVITAWHVIEHISELQSTFASLVKRIKKGGYFFVALPNLESYDAEYYAYNWAAYDVPRHLYHFSQSSFKHLYNKYGLKLVDTISMKYDSYYVSLLSEQNTHGHSRYFKALLTGLKSNTNAKQTGQYSSLIYVLKK